MTVAQFTPTKDSILFQDLPTTNDGAGSVLQEYVEIVGGAKTLWRRAILAFDVSSVAGEAINSAKLVRQVSNVLGAGDCWVTRITRTDWVEAQVTWNNYKSGSPWTAGGGDIDAGTPAQVGFSEPGGVGSQEVAGLVAFVTDAIANRGNVVTFIVRMKDESAGGSSRGAQWHSKEGATDPVLEVDYAGAVVAVGGRRGSVLTKGPRPAAAARASRGSVASAPARPSRSGKR